MRILKDSDILLINPAMDRVFEKREEIAQISSMPPLGLLYILSGLEDAGYRVSFIDMTVEAFDKSDFLSSLDVINPHMVGITTYVESWNVQSYIMKVLKGKFPKIALVAGGHCAHFCYNDLMDYNKNLDFITRGEGEISFVKLADYIFNKLGTLEEIDGLVYRGNERIIVNKEAERINDIDSLPYPNRDVLELDMYGYPFTLSTARGCPGRCIFCSSHAFWGNKLCLRKPEEIVNEISFLFDKYKMNEFFIVDDTFTLIPKRTMEFCNTLRKLSSSISNDFVWGCESRADVVDYDLLKTMYDAGCRMIQFGMESGNNEILKSIKKAITYEQLYNAVKISNEIGINTNISFIIGHPEDTVDTVNETILKALDLKKKYNANVLFSINTPYPGTELYNRSEDLGVEILTTEYNQYKVDAPIINTKHLSTNDIRRLYAKAMTILHER